MTGRLRSGIFRVVPLGLGVILNEYVCVRPYGYNPGTLDLIGFQKFCACSECPGHRSRCVENSQFKSCHQHGHRDPDFSKMLRQNRIREVVTQRSRLLLASKHAGSPSESVDVHVLGLGIWLSLGSCYESGTLSLKRIQISDVASCMSQELRSH